MSSTGAFAAGGSAVEAPDAIRLVAAGEVWLLDVREPSEWQAGHVAQAHHIPMGELQSRQDELPADESILVICHSGQRSRLVADALLGADYRAANLEGGIVAWQAAGGEITA